MKNERLILLLLILIKLIISLPFIASNPIDLDEPFSIFHAQKSIPELFQVFSKENNPPLHFLLLHYWESLFGIDAYSVRSLSLLFSVLTIPILWSLGKIYTEKVGAIMLCTLFIFSDFHQFHGLEARTYSLLVFEYAALLLIISRIILLKSNRLVDYLLLGIVNVSLFYTHYIFPFILFSEFILLLVFIRTVDFKKTLLSIGIFIVLILPWTSILMTRSENVGQGGTWLNPAQWTELYGVINKFFNDKWAMLALILTTALLLIIQFRELKLEFIKSGRALVLLGILFFIPYITTFSLSKFAEIALFFDRYLFFLTIPLFLVVSIFFSKGKTMGYVLFSIFLGVYLMRFDYRPDNGRDGDKLAQYVKETGIKTIFIAPYYYDLTFVYHYDRSMFKHTNLRSIETQNGIIGFEDKESYRDILEKEQQFVVIDADFSFTHPHTNLYPSIQSPFKKISERTFKGNYKVSVFKRND